MWTITNSDKNLDVEKIVYRVNGREKLDFATGQQAATFAMLTAIRDNANAILIQRIAIHAPLRDGSVFDEWAPTETVLAEATVLGPVSY